MHSVHYIRLDNALVEFDDNALVTTRTIFQLDTSVKSNIMYIILRLGIFTTLMK